MTTALSGRARRGALVAAVAALAALAAAEAGAHMAGQSYLYLQVYPDRVAGRFELPLEEWNAAHGRAGTDRAITDENLDAHVALLQDYYRQHVTISAGEGPLEIRFTGHSLLDARGGYVRLPFELPGLSRAPERMTFDYSVLFDEDPGHRGFLIVEHNYATGTFANESGFSLVFSPGSRRQELDLTTSGWLRGVLALVRLGAEHVLLGLDHLFFLVALLLPVALRREGGAWQPLENARPAVRRALEILAALAASHALALALAALVHLHLPEALVETGIAASTTLAAANVFFPLFRGRDGWFIFGLGLFHGLGLAGGLAELGALGEHRWLSTLAFLLGVVLAQVLVAAVVLAALLLVRRTVLYRRALLPLAAAGMILVSGVWVVERAFGVDVPMRELLPRPVQKVLP
jgi:hypothetical protein